MGFYGSTYRPSNPVSIKLGIDASLSAEVKAWASRFPAEIQSRLMKHGAVKAAKALVKAVRPYIPRSAKDKGEKGHIQDSLSYKVKGYTSNKRKVVFIGIGYKNVNKVANLQHLIEFGNWKTRPRLINHKTAYFRPLGNAKTFKLKTVKRRDGSVYQKKVVVRRNTKISLGSFRKEGIGESSSLKSRISGESRGNFPKNGVPYAPLQRGLAATGSTLHGIITEDVKAGLTRITKRAALGAARRLK